MGKERISGTSVVERVDALGLVCPMPLIRLQQQIELLDIGQRLEVVADDQGFRDDLPGWGEATGHRIVSVTTDAEGYTVALVEKA